MIQNNTQIKYICEHIIHCETPHHQWGTQVIDGTFPNKISIFSFCGQLSHYPGLGSAPSIIPLPQRYIMGISRNLGWYPYGVD